MPLLFCNFGLTVELIYYFTFIMGLFLFYNSRLVPGSLCSFIYLSVSHFDLRVCYTVSLLVFFFVLFGGVIFNWWFRVGRLVLFVWLLFLGPTNASI